MTNVKVNSDFIEFIKESIPRRDKPIDCEILSIEFGYRSCYFLYKSPVHDSIQNYTLILDAY